VRVWAGITAKVYQRIGTPWLRGCGHEPAWQTEVILLSRFSTGP